MWAELVIFIVDLMLALGVFAILYAVYLAASMGILILVLLYTFKGEMGKNCDFNEGRIWVLDSGNPSGSHSQAI